MLCIHFNCWSMYQTNNTMGGVFYPVWVSWAFPLFVPVHSVAGFVKKRRHCYNHILLNNHLNVTRRYCLNCWVLWSYRNRPSLEWFYHIKCNNLINDSLIEVIISVCPCLVLAKHIIENQLPDQQPLTRQISDKLTNEWSWNGLMMTHVLGHILFGDFNYIQCVSPSEAVFIKPYPAWYTFHWHL